MLKDQSCGRLLLLWHQHTTTLPCHVKSRWNQPFLPVILPFMTRMWKGTHLRSCHQKNTLRLSERLLSTARHRLHRHFHQSCHRHRRRLRKYSHQGMDLLHGPISIHPVTPSNPLPIWRMEHLCGLSSSQLVYDLASYLMLLRTRAATWRHVASFVAHWSPTPCLSRDS